ncbi:hypothetical protein BO70DRAFT_398626 [Aspergillus heteromorphus CBS 117.55]|uniref:Uncharacterized protein n=1 Tax=Aspergillus heteromorphus CBS 117.55 TaxID=1448321 RepID=A0A317VMI0_9EURO|nr:uncharacterized protein BO70DRAFT_398626 [Aspergillus heteromorphus CBS 117.55]PWY74297.1 hypothetical protein BO70DRAFT_398626 [Aspergillus heteromorphus CBS 117.55]
MDMTGDQYLEYIPIAWSSVNTALGFPLTSRTLWDMMVISMLNYQADENMESVVASPRHLSEPDALSRELQPTPPLEDTTPTASLLEVGDVLLEYIHHIRQHHGVRKRPEAAHNHVVEEPERSRQFQDASRSRYPKQDSRSYFNWARTTGANNTSCPYSFTFFCRHISGTDPTRFSSVQEKYFARALGSHLATMCRQYNDYGSQRRDVAEMNLSSLDFPQFQSDHAKAKENAFVDGTDLIGKIYAAQDIASLVQE